VFKTFRRRSRRPQPALALPSLSPPSLSCACPVTYTLAARPAHIVLVLGPEALSPLYQRHRVALAFDRLGRVGL